MSGFAHASVARAESLVGIFHEYPNCFARFSSVPPDALPTGPRTLLDHTSHMTLAMERFHGGPVSLTVVNHRDCEDGRYAREILLADPDGRVVQYGIVRIDLSRLPTSTQAAIRSAAEPLGRILLAAGLHCDVHDVDLLRVDGGAEFASIVGVQSEGAAFGRVASIGLNGQAMIELLEIVAPGTAGHAS